MKLNQWKPHVTVAAIVEQNGKFLLVEEETNRGNRFNQPAGHLEDGESIIAAAKRETLEESAYAFTPDAIVGIYQWKHPLNDITYLRFAFSGQLGAHYPQQALDEGIVRAVWMTLEEIKEKAALMRSPQVISCIEDYLNGQRFPLNVITHLGETI
jgi:8-oxo-dGTP pyrophosphatase MutT (NUDIX family)